METGKVHGSNTHILDPRGQGIPFPLVVLYKVIDSGAHICSEVRDKRMVQAV